MPKNFRKNRNYKISRKSLPTQPRCFDCLKNFDMKMFSTQGEFSEILGYHELTYIFVQTAFHFCIILTKLEVGR